jgi:hypothetical protein
MTTPVDQTNSVSDQVHAVQELQTTQAEPRVEGPPEAVAKLAGKLTHVMASVDRVKKRGKNTHFNYDFATEADINAAVRQHLAEQKVIVLPAIVGVSRNGHMTSLDMRFTIIDGDSGARIILPWAGAGEDKGDKGIWKAITGAVKYFIAKSFLIPTGDDPEIVNSREKDERREVNKATARPEREGKKARPSLPKDSGAVFIDKVVPKKVTGRQGNREWAEVTFSDKSAAIVFAPQQISLCQNLAWENTPVVAVTHLNGKGHAELDSVVRWKAAEPTPVVMTPQLRAADIPFSDSDPAL